MTFMELSYQGAADIWQYLSYTRQYLSYIRQYISYIRHSIFYIRQ